MTKKEERIREKELLSNVVTSKMIIVFMALVLAIVLMVRVCTSGAEAAFVLALPYASIAFGVLTAAALVWSLLCKKNGVDEKRRVFSSPLLLGLAASGLFTCLLYTGIGGAFRMILVLIAFALLFFVYQIYSADFFVTSVAAVAGAVASAIIHGALSGSFANKGVFVASAAAAFAAVVLAFAAWFVFTLQKAGKVAFLGTSVKKTSRMVPAALYAVLAVAVLAVAASFFVSLLYCVAAVAVAYLVVAIIYTVKLM